MSGAAGDDDDALDGRVLAGASPSLKVRRGSKVATDILGDADVPAGESAIVRVAGTTDAPARAPRRKLKLVGPDGQVTREVDDVALVGALAVRAEIETARAGKRPAFTRCERCGDPVRVLSRGPVPSLCKPHAAAQAHEQKLASAERHRADMSRRTREWRHANPERARAHAAAQRARKKASPKPEPG